MRDATATSPRRAWTLAVLLWAAVVGMTAFEIAPASVLTLVSADLGIGRTGVSWLVSVFLLGMVVFSLPAGFLLDRVDNRHVVPVIALAYLGTTVWSALAAEAGVLWSLFAARFVSGAVNVVLWTGAINLVGGAFGADRQGTSIGFLSTAIPAGFAIAHTVAPVLATTVGWERSFVVFGLVTTASGGAFWLYTRNLDLRADVTTPTRTELVRVLRNRWVWAVAAMAFIAFSLNLFFNNWLPTYLVEEFGLDLEAAGIFAAVFPAIGAVARVSSGAISDSLFDGRRSPIVLGSFLVIAPLVVVIAALDSLVLLLAVLVVAGFVTQMGLALLLPYVRELVAANVAATALSVLNMVGLAGAFSAPVITGTLIDATGAYTTAFGYAAALAAVGIVLARVVPEPT